MVSNMENLNPQVIRLVGREMGKLMSEPLEGITVLCNDKNMSDVEAIIDGPADTPYHGGKFRVKLVIGGDFPASPPKGYFITKIFHPNVAVSSGEICVNTLKKDWKSDLGIKHVLLTVKCLLIVPNPESALNEEAGKLLLEHYDDYCSRAKLYTEIHAQPAKVLSSVSSSGLSAATGSAANSASSTTAGPSNSSDLKNKLSAADKKALSKKEKNLKEKKKTLKRL